ncbi:MAG: hypothetical protein R3B74_16915 [Nitrospirales bacterium]|nr:hypothetical protein [Nitrospirales bacterium]
MDLTDNSVEAFFRGSFPVETGLSIDEASIERLIFWERGAGLLKEGAESNEVGVSDMTGSGNGDFDNVTSHRKAEGSV